MPATCQVSRSKGGKDSLTLSALVETEQRNQHPSTCVEVQREPHISLEMQVVFKQV